MRWLFAVVVLAGCATAKAPVEGPKAERAAAEFYPLGVGNAWTYEVNLLGEKRSVEVKLLREAGGYVEDSTGAQLSVDAYGVRDQKRYLLRNPVQAGTKWTNVVSVSSVEHYEIIGAGQPCDSPAGQFEGCAVVESKNRVQEGRVLVNEMTFAPGVGLVRVSTVLEANGKRIPQSTLVLTAYSVGKGASAPAR